MLKKRLDRLEDRLEDATARWLRSLTDDALRELAGEISLKEQAFLAALTTEQLEDLAAGRVSLGQYEEMKRVWALQNVSNT